MVRSLQNSRKYHSKTPLVYAATVFLLSDLALCNPGSCAFKKLNILLLILLTLTIPLAFEDVEEGNRIHALLDILPLLSVWASYTLTADCVTVYFSYLKMWK